MVSKEQKKKAIKIYRQFVRMVEKGTGRMEAYKKLAVRYGKSLSGIRYAVMAGKDYSRTPAGPIPDEFLSRNTTND